MPQPIDFHTEVAKTTAAQRIQEVADRAAMAAQQRLASEQDESRLRAETQVQQSADAKNPDVDGDGRRKNPFAKRKRAGQEEQNDEQAHRANDGEAHSFDVTV
jgi:hypothetical protein